MTARRPGLDEALDRALEDALGQGPLSRTPLLGGCVAEVYRLGMREAEDLVAKWSPAGGLAVEGFMLGYLAEKSDLPVPAVHFCSEQLLIMAFVPNGGGLTPAGEKEAAEQLVALHSLSAESFGFERDTVIGMLPQPNPWQEEWPGFYRDQRLRVMGRIALDSGRIMPELFDKLERLCGKLDRYLDHNPKVSLTHGDIWGGNVLCRDGRVTAYIDPALYFADREVELAYLDFLQPFGPAFWQHYRDLWPLDPGYSEVRRDLYQLFPLLVHCQICGGGYPRQTEAIVDRFL